MSAIVSAPGLLSAAVKSRPTIGCTPSARRNPSVTYAPVNRCGFPSIVTFTVEPLR